MSAEFNFDWGDEFEIALCEVLRSFLPNKYGVCRGFVVTAAGEVAGDDIIIFDKERFPTLRFVGDGRFDIKQNVPVEAVYGYIEAKHKLDAASFARAFFQVSNVKRLVSTRASVGRYQHDPYIESNLQPPYPVTHLPEIRNPLFTMIFSRYSVKSDGVTLSTDGNEIHEFLNQQITTLSRTSFIPDVVIAGEHNFLSPANIENGVNKPTLFWMQNSSVGYQVIKTEGISYGVGLAHLMAAIDWIKLGVMPWERILNDSRFPESMQS